MLCTSSFVDDVMFSHNGANGPKSNTTHMFRPIRQVKAAEAKRAVSDYTSCTYTSNRSVNLA